MSSPAASTRRATTSPALRCRPAQLGAILDLIAAGTISGKIAKDLFEIVWSEGGDPQAIVEARGMKQVTDLSAIEKVVDEIIADNPDKVAQAKAKPAARRLVRRPGDESVRRQGQPAGGERPAQAQARHLSAASRSRFVRAPSFRAQRIDRAGLIARTRAVEIKNGDEQRRASALDQAKNALGEAPRANHLRAIRSIPSQI